MLSKIAPVVAAAGMIGGVATNLVKSAVITQASKYGESLSLGRNQKDVGFISLSLNGNNYVTSCFLIRGVDGDVAGFAAHAVTGHFLGASINYVGRSNSYLDPTSSIVSSATVGNYSIDSEYLQNNSKQSRDLAFVRLADRITDTDSRFIVAASQSTGSKIMFGSYGDPDSLDLGPLEVRGDLMGFSARLVSFIPSTHSNLLYNMAVLDTSFPDTGADRNRGSGGVVKDINNNFLGMIDSASSLSTTYLDFNELGTYSRIVAYANPMPIPEPITLPLVAAIFIMALSRARRA